jgi:DNA polymerase-3 subunit delta'
MAEEQEDPRETPLHPRFARQIVGHAAAMRQFEAAHARGKLHHAWLICGPQGVGKATLAYAIANFVLQSGSSDIGAGLAADTVTRRWIHAKSHPDLFVLERQLADRKPVRLKAEISVDDSRKLTEFFSRTAGSSPWRVAIIDAADDLNRESANALLKLVEEPPPRCLVLLVCTHPGRLLRTLKSRCLKLTLSEIETEETRQVLENLELDPELRESALAIASGSPGRALAMAGSNAAAAFRLFPATGSTGPELRYRILQALSSRTPTEAEYETMSELLLGWTAGTAETQSHLPAGGGLADAYLAALAQIRETLAYNLDRKQALTQQMRAIDDALKGA